MAITDEKIVPRNIGCAFMMIKQKGLAKQLCGSEFFKKKKLVKVPMSLYES